MVQAGADTGLSVPYKAVQTLSDRVVAVLISGNLKRRRNLFFTGDPIGFLKVQEQIFHIGIRNDAGAPAPAQIPDNINALRQQVIADSTF